MDEGEGQKRRVDVKIPKIFSFRNASSFAALLLSLYNNLMTFMMCTDSSVIYKILLEKKAEFSNIITHQVD